MALVPGKRTFICRTGEPYELPDRHTAEWVDFAGTGAVSLRSPGAGGIYWIESVDETDDRVTVRVGEYISMSGPGGAVGQGQSLPEVRGYPFLDD